MNIITAQACENRRAREMGKNNHDKNKTCLSSQTTFVQSLVLYLFLKFHLSESHPLSHFSLSPDLFWTCSDLVCTLTLSRLVLDLFRPRLFWTLTLSRLVLDDPTFSPQPRQPLCTIAQKLLLLLHIFSPTPTT